MPLIGAVQTTGSTGGFDLYSITSKIGTMIYTIIMIGVKNKKPIYEICKATVIEYKLHSFGLMFPGLLLCFLPENEKHSSFIVYLESNCTIQRNNQ